MQGTSKEKRSFLKTLTWCLTASFLSLWVFTTIIDESPLLLSGMDLDDINTYGFLTFVGAIFLYASVSAFKRMKSNGIEELEKESQLNNIQRIELKLRTKVRDLHRLNIGLLVLICITLSTGVFIFISAEELASDNYLYASIKQDSETVYKDMTIYIDNLESKLEKTAPPSAFENKRIEEINKLKKGLNDQHTNNIKTLTDLQSRKSDVYEFISAMINKAGSIIILLFFVQIIVNLYRYNTKLATFYESRANALGLFSGSIENVTYDELLDRLYPTDFDFDKNPKAPVAQFSELLSNITPKMNPRKEKKADGQSAEAN